MSLRPPPTSAAELLAARHRGGDRPGHPVLARLSQHQPRRAGNGRFRGRRWPSGAGAASGARLVRGVVRAAGGDSVTTEHAGEHPGCWECAGIFERVAIASKCRFCERDTKRLFKLPGELPFFRELYT